MVSELVRKFQLKDTEFSVSAEVHESSVEFHIYKDDDTDYLFSGYVKWDGCSNWDFQSFNERVGCTHPLHFCSKEDTIEFGVFLGKLYDWTAELIKVLTDEEVASW
jgi:hypothetical protein